MWDERKRREEKEREKFIEKICAEKKLGIIKYLTIRDCELSDESLLFVVVVDILVVVSLLLLLLLFCCLSFCCCCCQKPASVGTCSCSFRKLLLNSIRDFIFASSSTN